MLWVMCGSQNKLLTSNCNALFFLMDHYGNRKDWAPTRDCWQPTLSWQPVVYPCVCMYVCLRYIAAVSLLKCTRSWYLKLRAPARSSAWIYRGKKGHTLPERQDKPRTVSRSNNDPEYMKCQVLWATAQSYTGCAWRRTEAAAEGKILGINTKADRNHKQVEALQCLRLKPCMKFRPVRSTRGVVSHITWHKGAAQMLKTAETPTSRSQLWNLILHRKVKKERKKKRCSERDNECVRIVWVRRGTAAINTACPSRGGKRRISDSCGINLNLITQLPSEPEPGCIRVLPRYVLHSNRTDLLSLNENVEAKYWKYERKCQTGSHQHQPLILYRLISLRHELQNLEKSGLTETKTGRHWVTLLGQSQSSLHSAWQKRAVDQATLPGQSSLSSGLCNTERRH